MEIEPRFKPRPAPRARAGDERKKALWTTMPGILHDYECKNGMTNIIISMTGPANRTNRARPYYSEPFAKGLRILRLFDPEHKSLTLKEISDALQRQPQLPAFRFTNTPRPAQLSEQGCEAEDASLDEGHLLARIGNSFSLLDVVKPFIDDVNERYNISVDSCVLEERALLQLYFRGAKDSPVYKALIINPAIHCTGLGKAILAYLPDDELAALLEHMPLVRRTRNSITDKRALLADLKAVRGRGYATNDEEYINGLITIAAPFFDLRTNRPIGAVSFDFPTSQASLAEAERKYFKPLLKLGRDISAVIKCQLSAPSRSILGPSGWVSAVFMNSSF
ncbi:MAG: hypothetical protein MZW92_61630 [Comamonadaceae bacterium]|nr:hypothetical protein [Comamonadaceae bacterium]